LSRRKGHQHDAKKVFEPQFCTDEEMKLANLANLIGEGGIDFRKDTEVAERMAVGSLSAHGDAGEGDDRETANGLTKEAGRLEDAEQQHVLNLGAGGLIGGAGDDAVVVYLA